MAMVDTVYWLPIGGPAVPADWLGPKVGGHLAPFLYSSRELSQWLCHDDSTRNIVVVILLLLLYIIIIDLIAPRPWVEPATFRSRVQRPTNATTKTNSHHISKCPSEYPGRRSWSLAAVTYLTYFSAFWYIRHAHARTFIYRQNGKPEKTDVILRVTHNNCWICCSEKHIFSIARC